MTRINRAQPHVDVKAQGIQIGQRQFDRQQHLARVVKADQASVEEGIRFERFNCQSFTALDTTWQHW